MKQADYANGTVLSSCAPFCLFLNRFLATNKNADSAAAFRQAKRALRFFHTHTLSIPVVNLF